ncbi:MAG: PAS domain-containing protein [Ferrovibrio sp.]
MQRQVDDARLAHVLSCWRRWRAQNPWPARDDIDPSDLRQILPNLFLVEPVNDGERFRYILSGAAVRQQLGFELSGRYLDDTFIGVQLERIVASYRTVISGHGHYALQLWSQRGRPIMHYRRLLLPMAANHIHIDLVLGFALYDPLEGHDGKPIDHLRDPVTINTVDERIIDLTENGPHPQ